MEGSLASSIKTNPLCKSIQSKKHLMRVLDFSREEIEFLVSLALELKRSHYEKKDKRYLEGKCLGLIFQLDSTRTRCSFEVAMAQLGGSTTYMGPTGSHLGSKESVKDSARVLSRFFDGIEFRGNSHTLIQEFADHSRVPVLNGMSDLFHPTQMIGDLMTMKEALGIPLKEIKMAVLGNLSTNVSTSLLAVGAILGMEVRMCGPQDSLPREEIYSEIVSRGKESGAKILCTEDVELAVKDAHVIVTDVWVGMGEPKELWAKRFPVMQPFQVNADMMQKTGNPNCKFMHCLPAFHNDQTALGGKLVAEFGMGICEVTDQIFESPNSLVMDEAENRMHSIKAIILTFLSDLQ